MSQAKIFNPTNLRFFSAVLLATTAYSLNPTMIEVESASDTFTEEQLLVSKNTSTYQDLKHSQNGQKNLVVASSLKQQGEPNLLLADNTDLAATRSDVKESPTRLIRLISLSFFFLFFVPLGIFYPLFLFYKMLLTKPDEPDDLLNSDRSEEFSEPVDSIDSVLQAEQDVNQATVSKLQIAFSPPARQLRAELSRVTSMTDLHQFDLVDLMHQTVDVLIEQGHWTHANYGSITLPLAEVRSEFNFISVPERTKFTSKTPSLVNHNRNISNSDGNQESYSYVVVTLILCTSHTTPLFKKINTKEQLVNELMQLGKMERDSVIKFELLWNPQQEGVYLSNDQLLTEYADMSRLL
ncbi:MAG: hypothetical protein RLZZ171_2715 [Cyanobacteriota bacterium]